MAINLGSIKTQVKAVLDTANTTTAAYDLSSNLATRVAKVLKVNPSRISPQSSYMPWLTVFVDRKDVEHTTIAKDQITAKRAANVALKLVGAVWDQTVPDDAQDKADDEIELLMENAEEVIRRNFKLNNTVTWSRVTDVSYHSLPLDEGTMMRVGVLSLTCRVDY